MTKLNAFANARPAQETQFHRHALRLATWAVSSQISPKILTRSKDQRRTRYRARGKRWYCYRRDGSSQTPVCPKSFPSSSFRSQTVSPATSSLSDGRRLCQPLPPRSRRSFHNLLLLTKRTSLRALLVTPLALSPVTTLPRYHPPFKSWSDSLGTC